MLEFDWLASGRPGSMLEHLCPSLGWMDTIYQEPSPALLRKARLFAVACCRRVEARAADHQCSKAIAACEALADGRIEPQELTRAVAGVWDVSEAAIRAMPGDPIAHLARAASGLDGESFGDIVHEVVEAVAIFAMIDLEREWYTIWENCKDSPEVERRYEQARIDERQAQADLVREIFGNPFQSLIFDPAWLAWEGGTIRELASAIYEEKAFERMPILGDALEEAGCSDPAILEHCRMAGEHVRGCWVVDALLGRS